MSQAGAAIPRINTDWEGEAEAFPESVMPTHEDAAQDDAESDPVQILAELQRLSKVVNIADELEEEQLGEIGRIVSRETKIDLDSRDHWERVTRAGMDLALQKVKPKTFPWPNAANICFPLMTTAATQFAARAYPAIVSGVNVVKAQVTGPDPDGQIRARGDRIAAHMSWQCLTEMPEWEPEVDRLLHALPIVGCAVKKTYFDPAWGRNRSDYVDAFDFIVNMGAASVETAPRLTQRFRLYPYQIEERFRSGIWRRFEYQADTPSDEDEDGKIASDPSDKDAPITFYEQHRRLDLDDDGYAEPYICTIHRDSDTVVRVRANFDDKCIAVDQANGKVIAIEPIQYFTLIPFMPSPDGGFYPIGFAWLLSPLNMAVNTVLNQLLDAGTLANTGGGFIGTGLRLKGGTIRFQPGQYLEVDVPGSAVKENIVPLTFPGPSEVLYKLLGTLVEAGREVASIKDVLTGNEPNANTPATTTLALIEQGLKVFTAIYKRIHRALKSEYAKLYRLNQLYLDVETQKGRQNAPQLLQGDYQGDPSVIVPVSDPQMVSDMQKLARAEFLKGFLGAPQINPMTVYRRIFEAAGIENVAELFVPPPKGPSPQALAAFAELEAKIKNMQSVTDLNESKAMLQMAQAASLASEQELATLELLLKGWETQMNANQGTQANGNDQGPMGQPQPKPGVAGNAPIPNGLSAALTGTPGGGPSAIPGNNVSRSIA